MRQLTLYAREAGGFLLDSDGNVITDSDGFPLYERGERLNVKELDRAQDVSWGTMYPGGLYSHATFIIPGTLTPPTNLRSGYEIAIYDGPRLVFEGFIDSMDVDGRGNLRVDCVGPWTAYFERRGIDRRWADDRITNQVMKVADGSMQSAWHRVIRGNKLKLRLHASDRSHSWANGAYYGVSYSMPTGETVGRITLDYDFFEPSGQNWEQRIWDSAGSTYIFQKNSSSSGSTDITLGTPRNTLQFRIHSAANQTPSDTVQADFMEMKIYASRDHASATLGNVNAYEISLDILDRLTGYISADITQLDSSLNFAVVPFYTRGRETYSKIMERIAGYGDSSQNSIGFGLRRSQLSADDAPQMFLETYPALTDYDYEISMDDGDVRVRENTDDVYNWISVRYRDAEGDQYTVTPDDDATLKNDDSISTYGQREITLNLQSGDQTTAVAYGTRYLARYKDPTWAVSAPIEVTELLSKQGGIVPAAHIESGKRLRIVDLPNRPNAGILGVTYVIVSTDYDNERGTVRLSVGGTPDDLSVYLARLAIEDQIGDAG